MFNKFIDAIVTMVGLFEHCCKRLHILYECLVYFVSKMQSSRLLLQSYYWVLIPLLLSVRAKKLLVCN